jgi:hypothetical protein
MGILENKNECKHNWQVASVIKKGTKEGRSIYVKDRITLFCARCAEVKVKSV